jgi:hypothetical protein
MTMFGPGVRHIAEANMSSGPIMPCMLTRYPLLATPQLPKRYSRQALRHAIRMALCLTAATMTRVSLSDVRRVALTLGILMATEASFPAQLRWWREAPRALATGARGES